VTITVSFTAASLLGSVAAVEVGAGVATGAVESKTAGVEVVIGVAALVDAGMVVVTVVAVLAGAGMVVVVVSWVVSCEGSASRITNTARRFAMAFQIPSGNSPDRLSFHSNSICRSLASHCATVLSIGYAGADVVAATAAGLISGPVWMAEGRSSRLRRFFAAFHQMSSIFGAREINREKK
jgi:hypothetical protein